MKNKTSEILVQIFPGGFDKKKKEEFSWKIIGGGKTKVNLVLDEVLG